MFKKAAVALLICQVLGTSFVPALAAAPSDADSINALRSSAIEAYLRGQVDKALEMYGSAVKQASRAYGSDSTFVGDLYFDMGVVALNASRYPRAEECLREAVKRNRNSVTARLKLAELLQLTGNHAEAKQLAQKVLAAHRDSVEAREVLARSYQSEGNIGRSTRELALIDAIGSGQMPQAEAPPVWVPPTISSPAVLRKQEPATKVEKATPAARAQATGHGRPEPAGVQKHAPATRGVTAKGLRTAGKAQAKGQPQPVKNGKGSRHATTAAAAVEEMKAGAAKPAAAAEEAKAGVAKPAVSEEAKTAVAKPAASGKHGRKGASSGSARTPRGLVPPPPPVVPSFPAMYVPPPTPPPRPAPKPRPVETVREEKGVHTAPSEETSDFLLDWANDKGKKKGN